MALALIGAPKLTHCDIQDNIYWMGNHDSCLIGTSDLDCVYTTFSAKTMVYRREAIYEYTAMAHDGATPPASPLNPGNLDTTEHVITWGTNTTRYVPWWCLRFGFDDPYGGQLGTVYREVWQYMVPFFQLRFKKT